jgi:hypothetical protein
MKITWEAAYLMNRRGDDIKTLKLVMKKEGKNV